MTKARKKAIKKIKKHEQSFNIVTLGKKGMGIKEVPLVEELTKKILVPKA